MTDHDFVAGFHSSPNRFAVAPNKNDAGTDFVVDPKNYSNIPEGKHIWFYPDEQYKNMMFQEINFGGWFFDHMILYDDWTMARPSIEVYKGNNIMRLGSIRAHMQPGTSNERIFFAQINKENIFYEETPNRIMSAGESYTSVRHPTIPGRWRMSGRVRAADGSEHYYTQDIYNQNFAFVSPIRGTLEAVALYLYDRTGETPSDITTPMDVYRDITGQITTITTPTFSIPSGTYPNSQSISISTSTTGATIRYTIDGTTPTETSSIYSTPIVISSTTTLKARAWKSGLAPSGIATATYTISTPAPVPVPAPAPSPTPIPSFIKNPGFESGTTPWLFYTTGAGTFSTVSPGYEGSNMAQVTLSSGGSNIQLYQKGIALVPNTRYRLSFAAYSTTGHDVTVKLFKHVSPYTVYAPDFTADLGTGWQTFTTEFTTSGFSGPVTDGRLQFWLVPFGVSGDNYYIDDVRLEKVSILELPTISTHPADQTVEISQTATFSVVATGTEPLTYQWQKNGVDIPGATNPSYTTPATILSDSDSTFRVLITNPAGSIMSSTATCRISTPAPVPSSIINPGFESGTTRWLFYTSDTGTFSIASPGYEGSNTAQLALTSGGSNIQLYQEGIILEPDTRYRLSFAAYSTTGHDVTVKMLKHVSPYTAYAPDFTANLGTTWQTFTTEFTTSGFTGIVNDGRLQFWLAPFAASGDTYYIDDIRLEMINEADTTLPTVTKNEPTGTNIPVSKRINVTFSETMDRTSVESAFSTSPATRGTFSWEGDMVTYTPNSDFVFETTYTVTIGTSAMDLAGNVLELPHNWEFMTEHENIPPTVTENRPTGTGVPVKSQVVVTFSETMDQTSVESAFSTSPATKGTFSWNGDTMTFSPYSDLAFETTYTVNIGTGAMDLADNNMQDEHTWQFTTEAIPTSNNIIQNPGYESGTSPWIFHTSGTGNFSIVSPGFDGSNSAKLALNSGGTNIQMYQKGVALEPDTRYRLSFAGYSTTGHDVTVKMLKHVSPYTAYAPDFTANLGTTWQTFTTEFTTSGFTGTVNDGRLQFWLAPFAASGDIYYIDDIQLEIINEADTTLTTYTGNGPTGTISPVTTQIQGAFNEIGSSSGGGGGGGSSGEDFYNIVLSETDRQNVFKNSSISYLFELEGNIINHINFTALKSAGMVAAKVELLNHTSMLASVQPPHEVYKNLNIWVGNDGWATKKNIAGITIRFKVDKAWIIENDIDETTIALYRYNDGEWNKLVTRKIAENTNNVQFEAETPGFSSFAIAGGEGYIEEPATENIPVSEPIENKSISGFRFFVGFSVFMLMVQILGSKK